MSFGVDVNPDWRVCIYQKKSIWRTLYLARYVQQFVYVLTLVFSSVQVSLYVEVFFFCLWNLFVNWFVRSQSHYILALFYCVMLRVNLNLKKRSIFSFSDNNKISNVNTLLQHCIFQNCASLFLLLFSSNFFGWDHIHCISIPSVQLYNGK